MERVCMYPGSFDPITVGHVDVIRRACGLFDRVVVAILHNPGKTGCFPPEERAELIRLCCRDLPQVSVRCFDGLTVEAARACGACAMVRGLRAMSDFENEETLAQINRRLAPELDTVFLMAQPEHSMISSSGVRELAFYGADIGGFVPKEIEARVKAHFQTTGQRGV